MTAEILFTNDATASLGLDGMTSCKKKRTHKHKHLYYAVYSCEKHKREVVIVQGTAPINRVFTSAKHG